MFNSQLTQQQQQKPMNRKMLGLILAFMILQSTNATLDSLTPNYFPPLNPVIRLFTFYDQSLNQNIRMNFCQDFPLNAGNTFIDYGKVRICNNNANMYIGVYAKDGFIGIQTIKIWIGIDLVNLPVSKDGGRPIPGQFPFKSSEFTTTTYYWSIKIPYTQLKEPKANCQAIFYIYIHADCSNGNTCWAGKSCVSSSKSATAWYCSITYRGICTNFLLRAQSPMLLASSPTTQCTNFKPAFAMGNKLLNDDPLKGWGWLYNTPADGSSVADITYDIYADAELNDISKGWFVGKVKYSYDNANKKAIAKFFIENSVQVSYYTAYVSDSLAQITSPTGAVQGCKWSSSSASQNIKGVDTSSLSFECSVEFPNLSDAAGDGIYFISYIQACKV